MPLSSLLLKIEKEKVQKTTQPTQSYITTAGQKLKNTGAAVTDSAVDLANNATERAATMGNQAYDGTANTLNFAGQKIRSTGTQLYDSAGNALNSFYDKSVFEKLLTTNDFLYVIG